jgi:aryl-alcohol dehydrogenase-like predicted oxidoreductase
MKLVRLGRSELMVPQLGFGALPIQRVSSPAAERILREAYDRGVRFFDTARMYSDSEEKIGRALADVRPSLVLATKTTATDRATARSHLTASLRNLKTDYLDLVQLHNPEALPDPDDENSALAALREARAEGLVRYIGLTNHRLDVASAGVRSGWFDTVQFPLSYISTEKELALVELCREHDIGLIAMKALSGGLLRNVKAAFAFLRRFGNVVPIWGIQSEAELQEFLSYEDEPPVLDEELWAAIERDRRELSGAFCRGCGYCLPCPVDIPIPWAARMSLLLRRAPSTPFLSTEWQEKMDRIDSCLDCRDCASRCPYELDTPTLLRTVLEDYRAFSAAATGSS